MARKWGWRAGAGRVALLVVMALALALALGLAGLTPGTVRAATIVVNTTADEYNTGASCSLREAIQAANTDAAFGGCPAGSGADIITLAAGTYTLTLTGQNDDAGATGDLDVASSITINGVSAATTIIDGNNTDAIFDTFPAGTITFNLNNLTVQRGNPTNSFFEGGGCIYLKNTVTSNLTSVRVLNCVADTSGGGIWNEGTLTITGGTISGNQANDFGGGIHNIGVTSTGTTISNSTFSNNVADFGGGIHISTDAAIPVTITNSTFSGNQAVDRPGGPVGEFGDGGGIYASTDGNITVTGSTFTTNSAARNGGAVFFTETSAAGVPTLTLNYNRIVGNTATTSGSGLHRAAGTASAENNWWGCNAGPTAAPCDRVSGTADTDPWLVLRHTASPASIGAGGASTLTASFLINSASAAIAPANLGALVGVPVTFGNAVLGTISGAQASIQASGTATATFTAGATAGTGQADATVDSATATASITITRPATTVTSINRVGTTPTNTASVSWTVTFADAVSGLTAANFTLVNGGLGGTPAITAVTPSGGPPSATWTVTASTGSGNGTLGLDLTNDTGLSHSVGNLNFVGQVYTIDRTVPTADIVDVTPDPRAAAVASVAINFSEGVTGFDLADLTLTRDGNPVSLAGATLGGGGSAYTLGNLSAPTSADGTYVLTVVATGSGIADAAGNAPAVDASDTWVTDTTGPDTTITATPVNPSASANASFSFTGSDPGGSGVAGFECQLDGGGFVACASPQTYTGLADGSHTFQVRAVDAVGNLDPSPATYTWVVDTTPPPAPVVITPANGASTNATQPLVSGTAEANSTVTVFLDGTAAGTTSADAAGNWTFTPPTPLGDGAHTARARATDAAGNTSVDSNTNTFIVDTIAPDTTITATPANPSASANASFSFTGNDGGGSGVAGFECQLDGGGFAACTSPQTYTGLADGSHTFQVRAIDAVGNLDPSPASFTWTVDTAQPGVAFSSAAANPTNISPIPVTVTFDESVTGFTAADITAGNATVNNFAGSGSVYTFDLVPAGQGLVTADIAAGVAQDQSGNGNTAAAQFSRTYDSVAPTVAINQAAGQADPTNAATIHFTAVFNEPVTGFGDSVADVTVSGTAGATTVVVTELAPNNGTTYDVAVSGMTGGGTVIATIPAGAAQDLATNPSAASTSTDNSVVYDTTLPAVTINQAAGQADPAMLAPIRFRVVFSEPVSGFTNTDVALGGTAGATTTVVTEVAPNDGTTYDVAVSGMTGPGTVIASLPAGAAQDASANPSAASTSTDNTVTYAPVPPCDGQFADVAAGDPACEAIAVLVRDGVIRGYDTTPRTFGPDDDVQRAQVAAFLVRALGWQGRPTGPRTFDDFDGLVAELQTAALIVANACVDPADVTTCVTRGYGDGRFGITDPVSHAQVITFIARAFGLDPTFAWQPQPGGALPYSGVPAMHADDLRTYTAYAGAIPDAPTTQAGWDAPASRAWVAMVLYQALQSLP